MFHLLRTRITRPYRTSVALEEERLWVGFYRRVDNPAFAAEVIQHLDADADQKRTHPAVYLCCKESLRRKKARQARTKRIRSFMRRVLGGLLPHSESNLRPQRRHGARIVIEGLSESMREPEQLNASHPSAPRLDASATASRNAKAA
jgi:hypothetical protein